MVAAPDQWRQEVSNLKVYGAIAYCFGAAITYMRGSRHAEEFIEEEELKRGCFMPPELLALTQFMPLFIAVGWPITLPFFFVAGLASRRQRVEVRVDRPATPCRATTSASPSTNGVTVRRGKTPARERTAMRSGLARLRAAKVSGTESRKGSRR
jgi:hypothetical protein